MSRKRRLNPQRSMEDICREIVGKSLILKDARHDFERHFIRAVLQKARWNQTLAAKMLGVHRNTLLMKADRLGVKTHEKNSRASK